MKEFVSVLVAFFTFLLAPILGRFDAFAPPCSKPIVYYIGTFDHRFNLKQSDFLSALTQAEKIWEEPLGKDLFAYDAEKGKLAVNLVYDYRQEATQELKLIEGQVDKGEASYKALEREYASMKAEHLQLKRIYDERVAAFEASNALYERSVAVWNSGDRSSQASFQMLEGERLSLQKELGELKILEAQLNTKVKEINALVTRLNTVAKSLNMNVAEYNSVGASRGETFAGGVYTSDESGERIDIFQFENHEKLVRVLAHELGHALGLDHIEDKSAIMYRLNEGEADKPTEADLAAIKTLCKIK